MVCSALLTGRGDVMELFNNESVWLHYFFGGPFNGLLATIKRSEIKMCLSIWSKKVKY
jgi:hypothetical protein